MNLKVGCVTPCAPSAIALTTFGAHGVARPTKRCGSCPNAPPILGIGGCPGRGLGLFTATIYCLFLLAAPLSAAERPAPDRKDAQTPQPGREGLVIPDVPRDQLICFCLYFDGFGNKLTMHAYANPAPGNNKAAGYGLVRFRKSSREIKMPQSHPVKSFL